MRARKHDIAIARKLAKQYGMTIYFSKAKNLFMWACCDIQARRITLYPACLKKRSIFYTCLFHEIGHMWCADNGKYPAYHRMHKALTKSDKRMIRLTGWKAEKYVDKWAKQKLYEFDKRFKYIGYKDEDKKGFKEGFLALFK